MPFVQRDSSGKITRATLNQIMDLEFVPHGTPEIVAFLEDRGQDPKKVDEVLAELRRSDVEMARLSEDLVTVLLRRNLLKMSDLPPQVQDRMALRTKLRMLLQDVYAQASGS